MLVRVDEKVIPDQSEVIHLSSERNRISHLLLAQSVNYPGDSRLDIRVFWYLIDILVTAEIFVFNRAKDDILGFKGFRKQTLGEVCRLGHILVGQGCAGGNTTCFPILVSQPMLQSAK